MDVGIVGLGRLGRSLGRPAHQQGHDVVGWDPTDEHTRPLLRHLAVDDDAVHHVGEQPGIGHFVKLVHNAIEFGMLQAIGEVKWVTTWATDRDIPLPVESAVQMSLMLSRDQDWPAARANRRQSPCFPSTSNGTEDDPSSAGSGSTPRTGRPAPE